MSPLVLFLPLLCLITLVLRVAMRGLPPRTRYAWITFLSTLLIISGMLTSIAAVLVVTVVPLPAIVSRSLTELDARSLFPALPTAATMTAKDVSEKLKPLVTVISPARRSWFTKNEGPSAGFGAGALLEAGPEGYLIWTARHVIDESLLNRGGNRALVAMATGTWAGADVIARHGALDLLLLWMPRESGSARFVQPVEPASNIHEGEDIFVIRASAGTTVHLEHGNHFPRGRRSASDFGSGESWQ
jgi:hypothetical protein